MPLVEDLAGARLTLAVAEGAVAWVEKEAVVLRPAAVVVAAEEDDDGKKPSIEENQ